MLITFKSLKIFKNQLVFLKESKMKSKIIILLAKLNDFA